MSTIGKRIKEKRIELGLSQEDLAKRLGLKSKSTICKVETGTDNMTTDTVAKYAEALECSPAYLMGWNLEELDNRQKLELIRLEAIKTGRDKHLIDLTNEEYTMVVNYRCCDDAFKDTVRRMLAYQSKMREIK